MPCTCNAHAVHAHCSPTLRMSPMVAANPTPTPARITSLRSPVPDLLTSRSPRFRSHHRLCSHHRSGLPPPQPMRPACCLSAPQPCTPSPPPPPCTATSTHAASHHRSRLRTIRTSHSFDDTRYIPDARMTLEVRGCARMHTPMLLCNAHAHVVTGSDTYTVAGLQAVDAAPRHRSVAQPQTHGRSEGGRHRRRPHHRASTTAAGAAAAATRSCAAAAARPAADLAQRHRLPAAA